jgi:predicted Zn finger-like uncharacterized protein
MIVTCPSCASRYEFHNSLQAAGDVKITCRSCGNRWIELEVADYIEVEPFRKNFGTRPSQNFRRDADDLADDDVRRLVDAAREAKEGFDGLKAKRRKTMLGWAGYGAFSILPLIAGATLPELVVSAAPISITAYEALGVDVNIYGLEIRRIEQEYKIIKGTRVLAIKGDIINITNDIQRIPWLRFGLQDGAQQEVYHWTLDTATRPLRPGETTSFMTRIQAPPESARNVQIRFAHEQEIGSSSPL